MWMRACQQMIVNQDILSHIISVLDFAYLTLFSLMVQSLYTSSRHRKRTCLKNKLKNSDAPMSDCI